MEQVVMAALDVKELALALSYIKEIKGKFPKSQRCIRLTVGGACIPSLPHSMTTSAGLTGTTCMPVGVALQGRFLMPTSH